MNRHPIDRMADLKAEITAREDEFEQLRQQVIAGEVGATGAEWCARVVTRSMRRVSVADAERELPADLFEAVVRREQQIVVMLYRVAEHPRPKRQRKYVKPSVRVRMLRQSRRRG